jgi:hypothetical protein
VYVVTVGGRLISAGVDGPFWEPLTVEDDGWLPGSKMK